MALGRYGRGALLRCGTTFRRTSRRVTEKMGMRRYTAWLRRRRRQPYRGVGGYSLRRSRRRVGFLSLKLNAEQRYRAKGTLPIRQRRRLLKAGRGPQPQWLPANQSRGLDYAATILEDPTLQRLRKKTRYYRQPRRRVLWYARSFRRLVPRQKHHRRTKRLPRLLVQRLLLLANLPKLPALQRRWLAHCFGNGHALGLAAPARLGEANALMLGLLRLQPRRRSQLRRFRRRSRRPDPHRSLESRWRRLRRCAGSRPALPRQTQRAALQQRWRRSAARRARLRRRRQLRLRARRRARRLALRRARRRSWGRKRLRQLWIPPKKGDRRAAPLPYEVRRRLHEQRQRDQKLFPKLELRWKKLQEIIAATPPAPRLRRSTLATVAEVKAQKPVRRKPGETQQQWRERRRRQLLLLQQLRERHRRQLQRW